MIQVWQAVKGLLNLKVTLEMATNKIPSLEELQKLYEGAGGEGWVADGPNKGKKAKKVKVTPPPSVEAETNVEDKDAYCDIHFWMRGYDSWNAVLQDAKTEALVRGSSVLVFAHNHPRGDPCNHLCRQVKEE